MKSNVHLLYRDMFGSSWLVGSLGWGASHRPQWGAGNGYCRAGPPRWTELWNLQSRVKFLVRLFNSSFVLSYISYSPWSQVVAVSTRTSSFWWSINGNWIFQIEIEKLLKSLYTSMLCWTSMLQLILQISNASLHISGETSQKHRDI